MTYARHGRHDAHAAVSAAVQRRDAPSPGDGCHIGRRLRGGAGLRWAPVFVLAAAALLCLAGRARAKEADWPFVGGNSRHIVIAGETLDTASAPSVLQEQAGGRRGARENATFAQYYVQLEPSADQRKVHEVSSWQ